MNYLSLIIAGVLILTFVVLQIISFRKTKKKTERLSSLFPANIKENLSVKEFKIPIAVLKDDEKLQSCLKVSVFPSMEDGEEYGKVSLIILKNATDLSDDMKDMVDSINLYLCKNIGTSADFSVITDICNHIVTTREDEIQSTLNVPLYFGLAGTFSGIICGLLGLDVKNLLNQTDSLQHLFWGIIGAMFASLLGLILTIGNSAVVYRKATSENDKYKEHFFDFLRQELMPALSTTMAQSLNSLRGVLGHFVDSFGKNLDQYSDSAEMLNDNLEKQHLVLQELNHLSLTKTSMRIAETFKTLDESAKSLEIFREYQNQLNSTISNLDKTSSKVESIISTFNDFANELRVLSKNQDATIKLQQDFAEAINTHFPTGSEGREVWRKEFDTLIEDAQKTTEQLSTELTTATQYIANFVSNNTVFFETFAQLNGVIDTLVKYTNLQAQSYSQLSKEIVSLRMDYKDSQQESLELSKLTIEAIKEMTKQLMENRK